MTIYENLVTLMLTGTVVKAVRFESPKLIIRATRRCYGGKIKNGENVEILLTIGKPNYEEREIIRAHIQAGSPFPIKEIKMYYPKNAGRRLDK